VSPPPLTLRSLTTLRANSTHALKSNY